MKVKVKKVKKNPAPVVTEQEMDLSNPINLKYSDEQCKIAKFVQNAYHEFYSAVRKDTFADIKKHFDENLKNYCSDTNNINRPRTLKELLNNKKADKSKEKNIRLIFNNRNNESFSDEDIAHYCKTYLLTEISLDAISEMFLENIFEKDGKRFVLVPLLWLWNYIT